MYQLYFTAEYAAELDAIEAGASRLDSLLDKGVYHVLRRDPYKGHLTSVGLYVIRSKVITGLLVLQIYYRINEGQRQVELVSVRPVRLGVL